jgi:type VI secretion system secreted protein VgrG
MMAAFVAANTEWFTFKGQSGNFSVYSLTGEESVNRPFEFSIELVSRSANEDIISLLGTPGLLSISDRSGASRPVHGLIREMEQLHTANAFTHYRCILVPRLWYLGRIRDHRIFQNLSVTDIIDTLFKEQGFTGSDYEFTLSQTYEPREYCVQYGETDLHFISRLCEEEGIYFYFEHSPDGHKVCFCDHKGGPKIPGENKLRFFAGSGHAPETAVISRMNLKARVNSNASTYREWNFQKPRLDLEVQKFEPTPASAPVPEGMFLEQYRYPHLYQLQKEGARYAELQLLRQLTFAVWIEAEADVSRFVPSYTFSVWEHPRSDLNVNWWVVSVWHEGEQPGVLEQEAPDGRGLFYRARIVAIPELTRFLPALEHPKNLVPGQQTAIVTGLEGEEIFTDKYGRVKVQFFWDREGAWDEKTTCWIRVSQGWAGAQYGSMAIPRIGHEVVVSFLEGDPDRPLITGRVYHALNMPPYKLPENKTRSVFKSQSTPGKEGQACGFNELRIEDKKGEEEIYVHAEKDVNAYVKNDWKEHILHDKHETVDNFTYVKTEGETHYSLKGARKTEIFANDNLTVHGEFHGKADSSWLFKAGEKIVLEAGAEIALKAGGAWFTLNAGGAFMNGARIMLNSGGSAGSGSANPALPDNSVSVSETPFSLLTTKCKTLQLNNAGDTGAPVVNNANAAMMCKE